jgi:hypothetical protein
MDVLMSMRRVRNRVYSVFVMPSRLAIHGQLLERALEAGYRISSVGGFWRQIAAGGLVPWQRYLVLRHDVDTDPGTAAAMWDIDRGLAVESSYFFRQSTLAPALMADIAAAGAKLAFTTRSWPHWRRPGVFAIGRMRSKPCRKRESGSPRTSGSSGP